MPYNLTFNTPLHPSPLCTHTAQDELVGIAYSRWTTAGAMATRTVMEGRHSDLMSGLGANECIPTEDTYGQYLMQVSGWGSVYIY